MENHEIHNDPSRLLRYRDSVYATDLLVCAIVYFDFFTFLKKGPQSFDKICDNMQFYSRPADVLVSLLMSMELIEKRENRYRLADLSRTYLVSDSPDSLVSYYVSLKDRPQCIEFRTVLQSGKPAGWSSKKGGNDWLRSMQDTAFADSFTAAMDSRGTFLARRLAEKLNFNQHTALLNVAGGSGIYACSIAHRNNQLLPPSSRYPL